jgi:predicted hotdog family 3-hydroxylacyl-ACP dehydratase
MYKISELQGYMPHFGAMEWIDEVQEFTKDEGVCLVHSKEGKLYCDGSSVRQSSCLEFIAQSYGFIVASNIRKETGKVVMIDSAYLVGMRKVSFSSCEPQVGETLKINIIKEREIGEISFVRGSVVGQETGTVYCSATLKLYSE